MGAFDLERFKEEYIGNKTRLQYLHDNINYTLKFSLKCSGSPSYTYYVLNRPVFYYTKLREDIFFIDTQIITKEGTAFYTFTANEHSFLKRFSVIEASSGKKITDFSNISLKNLLITCMKKPNTYNIYLNIYDFEQIGLITCNSDYNDTIYMYNKYLKTGSLIKIKSFVNYNKRLWLYLFNNSKIEYPNKANLGDPNYFSDEERILSSKEEYLSENGGHFDVSELESRRKYKFFIS